MDPDEHRKLGVAVSRRGGGDVEVERGFARHAGLGDQGHAGVPALRGGAEGERVADSVPRVDGHRGGEAEVAHRGLCKGDAHEGRDVVAAIDGPSDTAYPAQRGVDDQLVLFGALFC